MRSDASRHRGYAPHGKTTLIKIPARRKVFLILDNLNVHKAKAVRNWLEANQRRIEVFYLPPYTPERNPSEYFNGDLKGAIQRDIPARDQHELKAQILGHLRRIQNSPARVRKYFEHELIRYPV